MAHDPPKNGAAQVLGEFPSSNEERVRRFKIEGGA